MMIKDQTAMSPLSCLVSTGLKALLITGAVFSVAACKTFEENNKITGWQITDPLQRHPIMVSQQPSRLLVKVSRGAYGLSPQQRASLIGFAEDYRSGGAGSSKLIIQAPSGGPNEVAAMQVVAEIRHILRDSGFDETLVAVEAYSDDNDPAPPVRVSFMRYVAEGPECGNWATNLAVQTDGMNQGNFGCANQKNLAAMVANPADLLGPRGETARPGNRRDAQWDKYIKGESSGAQKSTDERVRTKGTE